MNCHRILLAGLLCLAAGCQYGALKDHSRFKSAQLLQDSRTVVFTFHDFAYRPAAGMAAFPDGGTPRYVRDSFLMCTFDMTNGVLKKIMSEKNREWCNGQGVLHIVAVRGNAVLASQSGQKRSDLNTNLTRHHIVDVATGKRQMFDLSADLAGQGRVPGELYLVDERGTILIMTRASGAAKPAKGAEDEVPEIWVRIPEGRYIRAVATAHYEETVNNEVIYWNPGDRQFYAFNIDANATRRLDDYKVRGFQDITQGVVLGTSGSSVDFGVKKDDKWQYTPLPITADAVRGL